MELRKVERIVGDKVEVVRMIDLKAGDVFRLYEADDELLGTFRATEDAFLDHKGVAGLIADPVQ
jgi:hypothetical protein